MAFLNQDAGFDAARFALFRKYGWEHAAPMAGIPLKKLLPASTTLYRCVPCEDGAYFRYAYWLPESTYRAVLRNPLASFLGRELQQREAKAQELDLLTGPPRRAFIAVRLLQPVFAWVGPAGRQHNDDGGWEQIFLPFLADDDTGRHSRYACFLQCRWLDLTADSDSIEGHADFESGSSDSLPATSGDSGIPTE